MGSMVLPKRPTGTAWKRGTVASARWELTAPHGGGYQYRLCPADAELTEACFQKTPLEFAHPTYHNVRYSNAAMDEQIPATLVTEGGGVGWMVSGRCQPVPS